MSAIVKHAKPAAECFGLRLVAGNRKAESESLKRSRPIDDAPFVRKARLLLTVSPDHAATVENLVDDILRDHGFKAGAR